MNIWGIIEETEPGVWEIIYEGHVDFSRRSPYLYYFNYEELIKKQVEKILFVDKL